MNYPFCSMLSPVVEATEPGLTPGSSWIIHLYTNELMMQSMTCFAALRWIKWNEQLQSGKASQRPSLGTLFSFTTPAISSVPYGEFTMIG